MRRLLQLPIVVPTKIDDDDVPVPEIRLHVGGEARSQKLLVAAPRAVVIERRGVLEHVGDDNEGLAASVVDLLRPGNELQRLENRRLLADLRGQALFQRRGDRDQRSEEHTSELQSPCNLVCRLLLEKKKADGAVRVGVRRSNI